MVLRGQVFAGDALSHVAFTGALAAPRRHRRAARPVRGDDRSIALRCSARLGDRAPADDVAIGIVFACDPRARRVLPHPLQQQLRRRQRHRRRPHPVRLDLRAQRQRRPLAALIAIGIVAVLLAIARPLLFATLDPAVAAARGVPVRALGIGFLALLGRRRRGHAGGRRAAAARPARRARRRRPRLTANPYLALGLSAAFAVRCDLGRPHPQLPDPEAPPSSAIIAVAAGIYLLALLATSGRRPGGRERGLLSVSGNRELD